MSDELKLKCGQVVWVVAFGEWRVARVVLPPRTLVLPGDKGPWGEMAGPMLALVNYHGRMYCIAPKKPAHVAPITTPPLELPELYAVSGEERRRWLLEDVLQVAR